MSELASLIIARINLAASADPGKWEQLAADFERIGALSNAASCRRRAEHYRRIAADQAAELAEATA